MKTFRHFLLTTLLGVSALFVWNDPVAAGRIGGAIAERMTLAPNQSAVFDVPFAAGEPAVVSVLGNGTANLDVALYDGDGNSARGIGFTDRKTASMRVYREGLFRIEVRNLSPTTSTFVLRTN